MQRFFSAASQNRDPGFFESQVTGTPALQRTAPQVLRAALRPGHENYFGLSAAAFLHSDMNFLRSLPWSFLASASFEHCSEAAVRGASAFFSAAAFGAGADFAVGAGAAGVVVCANAELTSNKDAIAVAAAREENVIMTVPRVEDEHTVAA
jgi:hypothetical protein